MAASTESSRNQISNSEACRIFDLTKISSAFDNLLLEVSTSSSSDEKEKEAMERTSSDIFYDLCEITFQNCSADSNNKMVDLAENRTRRQADLSDASDNDSDFEPHKSTDIAWKCSELWEKDNKVSISGIEPEKFTLSNTVFSPLDSEKPNRSKNSSSEDRCSTVLGDEVKLRNYNVFDTSAEVSALNPGRNIFSSSINSGGHQLHDELRTLPGLTTLQDTALPYIMSKSLFSSRYPTSTRPFLVNLYVEDRNLHLGPFSCQISPSMTLRQLKMKVYNDLEIKPSSQKWILGNSFVDDDAIALSSYGVAPGSFIYLYIRAPENSKTCTTFDRLNAKASGQLFGMSPCSSVASDRSDESKKGNDQFQHQGSDRESKAIRRIEMIRKKNPRKKTEAANLPFSCSILVNEEQRLKLKQDTDCPKSKVANLVKSLKLLKTPPSAVDLDESCANYAVDKEKLDTVVEVKHISAQSVAISNDTEEDLENVCQIEDNSGINDHDDYVHASDSSHSIQQPLADGSAKNSNKCEQNSFVKAVNTEDYDILLQLEELNLIPNAEPFECPVCFNPIDAGKGVVLRDCLHEFCRECLACAVIYASESSVRCPYRDEMYSCNSCMQQREVKALVSTDAYEVFLQRSLVAAESMAEKSFHCRTADCPGWCLCEDIVNVFRCPVCLRYNCLTCQAIHEGLNCRQYQDHLKIAAKIDEEAEKTLGLLDEMMKQGKAMKCPRCCVVLMKKWGCDWLKCSVCQTEVCWITKGPRWGPEGRGDTSGGCKCGVNGKKCHISCTYCH